MSGDLKLPVEISPPQSKTLVTALNALTHFPAQAVPIVSLDGPLGQLLPDSGDDFIWHSPGLTWSNPFILQNAFDVLKSFFGKGVNDLVKHHSVNHNRCSNRALYVV